MSDTGFLTVLRRGGGRLRKSVSDTEFRPPDKSVSDTDYLPASGERRGRSFATDAVIVPVEMRPIARVAPPHRRGARQARGGAVRISSAAPRGGEETERPALGEALPPPWQCRPPFLRSLWQPSAASPPGCAWSGDAAAAASARINNPRMSEPPANLPMVWD